MLKKFFILFMVLNLLAGCAKSSEIQYQAFAIGLGIDFKDDQYIVYMQFLDFSQVAHQESEPIGNKKPSWISIGKGKTIAEAMFQIYHAMQIYTTFEHLSLFIITEEAIKQRMENITESLNAIYTMRTNGYVYSTDIDIKDIFASKLPFYYPPSDSQLNHPKDSQQGAANVPPVGVEDFLIGLTEDTRNTLLPRITLNESTFNVDEANIPVIELNGVVVMKGFKFLGTLSQKDLVGYTKFNNYTKRTLLQVKYKDNFPPVSIEVRNPVVKRKLVEKNGNPQFKLEVTMSIILREVAQKKEQKKLKKKMEKQIKEEILHSIRSAQKKEIDVYQFEDYLFRRHHHLWEENRFKNMIDQFEEENIILKIENVKSSNKIYNK